ncbi:hypothetical protein RJT34_04914 [Clitoria ternatea]|uniref:Homologous recombination OB-fold protein OB-fold domain-containing protein n=1 Tax=Clitoria ternatea TaxID=43366 RepID=A0AAN9Q3U8_CLITE
MRVAWAEPMNSVRPNKDKDSSRARVEICDGIGMEPWEALEVDDSDLSAILRPCKRRTKSLIPGPAGAVQAVMLQRSHEEALPTQEFIRRVVQSESDGDFNTNPWLSALQFLRSQQDGTVAGDDVTYGTPLSSIKNHPNAERVAQVVGVVKSCTPNGFGDMMVTLKDPTGTVGASVHRKVFTDGEFGKHITVGSVLVLQKVAVFSPTRSACYLNITLNNIVKVFSKDSGPPSQQQIYPDCSVIRTTPSIERQEKICRPGSTFPLPQPQERTEGIMYNLGLDSRFTQEADSGQQRGEILVMTSSKSDNGNQKTISDRENLSLSDDYNGRPVEVTCGGDLESGKEDQPNPAKFDEGDSLAWIAQGYSSTTKSVHTSHFQETGMKNHMETQKHIANQKGSIPHWTEEQLDELLAFD